MTVETVFLWTLMITRELLTRVLYLLKNYSKAKDISQAAVETAACYTWYRVAEETASFYEKLLKNENGGILIFKYK